MHIPGEDDGTGALDIIIKALLGVPIPVEVLEGLFGLKVLELDDHVRVDLLDGGHELIHELLLHGGGDTLLAQAQVQGVLQVGLIVGAAVEDDGKRLLGVDTGGGGVQSELADLDSGVSGGGGSWWCRCGREW